MSTSDPRTALAWLRAGRHIKIDAINSADLSRHAQALAALEAKERAA
ncbi:hypothetical protein [Azotobacter beijerinckii]|nr:hypothetical protein [Azotobacter beijerinckii]MDV7209948.1 hypothetical protein [Azotobacter beijerinckii]